MPKPKITDKLPSLEDLLTQSGIETALRQIMGADGSMNFSISLSPGSTSYSFSASNSNGETESYSKSVPYQSPEDNPSA